jgi:NADH-quinone oxidoreductase subunit N
MYFDTAEEESIPSCSTDMHLALSVNGLAILFLGLFPGGLIAVCSSVF